MILNYSTKIAPHRTVAEIQRTLSMKGAEAVTIEYGPGGIINAVLFAIRVQGQRVNYRLPCKIDGVLSALKRGRAQRSFQTREHAEFRSVAHRQGLDRSAARARRGGAGIAAGSLPFVRIGEER